MQVEKPANAKEQLRGNATNPRMASEKIDLAQETRLTLGPGN
jgi:hypothetical protein